MTSFLDSLDVQVEKPDPTNHTDARNPTTHAEEKGELAYMGSLKVLELRS